MATTTPIRLATAALLAVAATLSSSVHGAAAHATCGTARTPLNVDTPTALSVVRTRAAGRVVPPAYGWPVKPFDRQHPLRGFLNDPRIAKHSRAFHFGIDVAAPDGTAVYAVAAGEVFFDSAESVAVKTGPEHEFGYWHIVPSVRPHEIVRAHQLLGHIASGWGHVHFAERIDGRYVNPLRPGGLGPYTDPLPPSVAGITFTATPGHAFDLITEAYDTTWPSVSGDWANEPVTPALVQWRIVHTGTITGRWQTALDSRDHMLDKSLFSAVYAPATTQNHKGVAGRYCFYLARSWKPADGSYRIDVSAADTSGNSAVAHIYVDVNDGKIILADRGL